MCGARSHHINAAHVKQVQKIKSRSSFSILRRQSLNSRKIASENWIFFLDITKSWFCEHNSSIIAKIWSAMMNTTEEQNVVE